MRPSSRLSGQPGAWRLAAPCAPQRAREPRGAATRRAAFENARAVRAFPAAGRTRNSGSSTSAWPARPKTPARCSARMQRKRPAPPRAAPAATSGQSAPGGQGSDLWNSSRPGRKTNQKQKKKREIKKRGPRLHRTAARGWVWNDNAGAPARPGPVMGQTAWPGGRPWRHGATLGWATPGDAPTKGNRLVVS